MFEALACGVPLVCSPWRDDECLFPADAYLTVADENEMRAALLLLLHDVAAAQEFIATGLRTIHERHTCAHRVRQLLSIVAALRADRSDDPRPKSVASIEHVS